MLVNFNVVFSEIIPFSSSSTPEFSGHGPDVGGQHCQCPVHVPFSSGFSGKWCPVSVCCPYSVRIFVKKYVRCLSIRPDKDERELSGLSLYLSADMCHGHELNEQLFRKSSRSHGHGQGVKSVSTELCSTQRKVSVESSFSI